MKKTWSSRSRAVLLLATTINVAVNVSSPHAQGPSTDRGSLCILPHMKAADVHMGDPRLLAETYSLRLDDGAWVTLSATKPVLLSDIAVAGKHKIAMRGDGRPLLAFTFTFARLKAADLCLWQSDI